MGTIAVWLVVFGVCFVQGGRRYASETCSRSAECPLYRSCCRDADGVLIDAVLRSQGFNDLILVPGANRTGTCSRRKSGARVPCNASCGCIKGYQCHRDLGGVCCPGMSCWSNEDVKAWNQCLKDGTCALPP